MKRFSSAVLGGIMLLATGNALAQPVGHHIERGPIQLAEVVRRASVIVRGTVGSSKVELVERSIYTFHDLVVSETIKGATRTNITIAVPGGTFGNVRTDWPGAPALRLGDQMVFFGNPLSGRPSSYEAVGLFDGLVEIKTEAGTGNAVVAARGRPEKVEDFLAEVRNLSRR